MTIPLHVAIKFCTNIQLDEEFPMNVFRILLIILKLTKKLDVNANGVIFSGKYKYFNGTKL